jgi:hypothetical protein
MPNNVEREKQRAAEMILESEALTDDLKDTAAKHLLDWSVAQAERLATERAEKDLDRALSSLRRVTKRINNLVADRAGLTDSEFATELAELFAATNKLSGFRAQVQVATQSLLAERNRLDEATLVERITLLLTPSEPEGGTPPERAETGRGLGGHSDKSEGESKKGPFSRFLTAFRRVFKRATTKRTPE